MATTYKLLILGLPLLLVTAGCYRKECEIKCVDGFKITTADECDDATTFSIAVDHGTCTAEEHRDYWW